MTGPIKGRGGFPRIDVVQPVSPAAEVTGDAPKQEQQPKNPPLTEEQRQKARKDLQRTLQQRSDEAHRRGGVDESV